jgi:hypothetical protein
MNEFGKKIIGAWLVVLLLGQSLDAGVGDPQVATDHEWYPGELACSTFERLAETQASLFERVTGKKPANDQERVLASWLWRNTHYWHGEQGTEDLWSQGFSNDTNSATREYWTGLFAHGFGLCGTTHAQWTAEMEHLLGHNRARVAGVAGHNSFEVFLKGGAYGSGRWALLDHDVSTVIFDDQGERLLSIAEIQNNYKRLTRENTTAPKQRGWPICGLHPDDGDAFSKLQSAEYLAGYAGPPPIVYLRRGESLRRYVSPGLDDGKTFVYWGRNYRSDGVPGPERSRTWVNQPEKMYGAQSGSGYHVGQARFANAVYNYLPNFANGDYREGVIEESKDHVTFEFQSPYIIAATPANDGPWGIYEKGCQNGLVITSESAFPISISVDRGKTWQDGGVLRDRVDLTDIVKGHRQYWLRCGASAEQMSHSKLQITTVCQTNSSVIPRLVDHGTSIRFQATGRALVSAGPNIAQAEPHVIAGRFDSPKVTLELAAPRGMVPTDLYAVAHVASSNPPSPDVTYKVDYSLDQGQSWKELVRDWKILRQGEEPDDFWSQSFCWATTKLESEAVPVQVRFHNDGGKQYRRAELHLAYRIPSNDSTRVTFQWQDDQGVHMQSHEFAASGAGDAWQLPTGEKVKTIWVQYEPVF